MPDKIISRLEESMGAKAPFHFHNYWEAERDHITGKFTDGAICDNCGSFIGYVNEIKDANGDIYCLGSRCIERTGGEEAWKSSMDARDLMKWAKYNGIKDYKEAKKLQDEAYEEARKNREKQEKINEKIRQEELARKAISQYVGEVKVRQEFTATVTDTFSGEGAYGMWTLTKLIDDDGNVLSYFNNIRVPYMREGEYGEWEDYRYAEEGDKITFKATVKKHEEYKDEKQTSLSRAGKAAIIK